MSTRPRRFRHYDEEFKRSAVQLCLKGEKTVAELAEELGRGNLAGLPRANVGRATKDEDEPKPSAIRPGA
jgi:transposase-like protein